MNDGDDDNDVDDERERERAKEMLGLSSDYFAANNSWGKKKSEARDGQSCSFLSLGIGISWSILI